MIIEPIYAKMKLEKNKKGPELMGMYLNPGNAGFKRILNDYYVDKTGMIELINNPIDSMANLIYKSSPPFRKIVCCTNVVCIL